MVRREFKFNLRSLILWISIISILMIIIYIVYPSIVNSGNLETIDDMLKGIDPNLLKVFNMDISKISSVSGWLYSEGFIILQIFLSLYSVILGSSILLKEEDEKTIEYLFSKPISKNYIVTNKLLVGFINIFIMNIMIFIINLIGLYFSNDLDLNKLIIVSIIQLFSVIPFFTISILISTLLRKTKTSLSIGIELVLISYFFNILSFLSTKVEFFKYFSLYTLSNYREFLINKTININNLIIFILITIISTSLTYYLYNKKEFI